MRRWRQRSAPRVGALAHALGLAVPLSSALALAQPSSGPKDEPEQPPSSPVEEPEPSPSTVSAGAKESLAKTQPTVERSRLLLAIAYDLALPLGHTQNYNKNFSARGFTVEGRYLWRSGWTAGLAFGWQVFQARLDGTLTWETATVGGAQVRETSATPLTANLGFALNQWGKVVPFVRFGAGAARIGRRLDIGIRRFVDESWHLALVPELGAEIPLSQVMVRAALRYNHFVKSDDVPAQSYLSFSLGVGFN